MEDLPSEEDMYRQIMLTIETSWRNDLSRPEIEKWLSNFNGMVFSIEYERQIALWLLTNFVFYDDREVRHLARTMFTDYLHSRLAEPPSNGDESVASRSRRILHGTIFYYLGRAGESGGFILYYFRHENRLGLGNFIYRPQELPSTVDTIAFIDDVTISGDQARKYFARETAPYDSGRRKILLTFFATDQSIALLAEKDISVISAVRLDNRCRLFSSDSAVFSRFKSHQENAYRFAYEYGKKLKPSGPLGFDGGQYAFGFFYNTPDNCLPIFWAEDNGWVPITRRYDKVYGKGGLETLGKFV